MSETNSTPKQSLAEHLKNWEQNKLSLADYAKKYEIPVQRLYQARHLQKSKIKPIRKTKAARTEAKRSPVTEFLPVSLPTRLHAVSVIAPNGVQIHIHQALPMEEMALLIKALQP